MTKLTFDAEPSSIDDALAELKSAGTRLLIGSMVNAAGLVLGKTVAVERLGTFHRTGLGSAPVWNVFCIDGGIAFTDDITAVGDLRLRLDVSALRQLGDGLAWGAANLFTQDGAPLPSCARGTLARVEGALTDAGYHPLIGHELEFVLVNPDGTALDSPWAPYGLTGVLNQAKFIDDLFAATARAGIDLEQVHAEYGAQQFEFSLPPAPPVAAADKHALAKIIVGRLARQHGLAVSFSPAPFHGRVGNGAHQHFSLTKNGDSLFAGGSGPRGITEEGGAAIAGVIAGLPDMQGFLTGSILSGSRLAPGTWSGAYACWGLENRETSVRFLSGGPSNPHGANVEVKVVDPSANVYLASASILALAHEGIRTRARLPEEVSGDPGKLSPEERDSAGIAVLPTDPKQIIDTLDGSSLARRLLGDDVVNATVAVRRYEQETFGDQQPEALAERFRLAWSV
jgi:glutamine synthetase